MESLLLFAAGQVATTATISVKVAALTEGVLKSMLLSKLTVATMVLLAMAAAGVGSGGFFTATGRPNHPDGKPSRVVS